MFLIYSLLYALVTLILLPFEYGKRPKGLRPRWLKERLGFIRLTSTTGPSPLIWVHAVSVGEVISAVPFIGELKGRYPSVRIVLSTVTDTGQKVAQERTSGIADQVYLPFDLMFILKRLLQKVRPDLFITVETELWPNIFRLLKREAIPILVFNGRLSEDSFKGYRKIRFFIKEVIRCVDVFCMQDEIYGERVKALGADENRVRVTGNFKFDTKPPGGLPEWKGLLDGPVVLAGSTHEGEEELILSVFEGLRNDFPELNLVIAPRHPERFRTVEELIKSRGLSFIKRTELPEGKDTEDVIARSKATKQSQQIEIASPSARNDSTGVILILDTIGELASAYGIADIAIIGGSFVNRGGHNPLEPAYWGKAVVCGPHMENFPFILDFYRGGGAVRSDAGGLSDVLRKLLESPDRRKSMGEKARVLYGEKAGAVHRAMEVLECYLKAHLPLSEEKPLS